jgi:hypothetical protein
MTRIHEHDLGLTWVMDEPMERGSHALRAGDGRVWLVDPVQDDAALAAAAALGPPAGVLQLLDRHNRDCAAIAQALGVPHARVPQVAPEGAPFHVVRVVDNPVWKEVALWWPERRALVVAEVLGTAPAWTLDAAPVGVHPMRRLLPPTGLRDLEPEHLLVGHGPPLHGPDAARLMREAIDRSRRDTPRLLLKLPMLLRTGRNL